VRRVSGRRVATVLGAVLALSGIPASSSAQEVSTSLVGYEGAATGIAFTAFPRLPALLPVEAPVEATVALATATLSSGGQGFGRASTFYPGSLTAGIRPLLEIGAGARLPIPDYPVVVEAREFEEAKHAEYPGITMTTDVDPARSVSVADVGAMDVPAVLTIRSMRTESRTVLGSDAITATSTATLDGISIAGVVTIGSLVSSASVRSDGTTSTCSGRVTVEDVLVAGSRATVDDEGLQIDGQPAAPGLGLGAIAAEALAAAGVEVRLLGGVSSCNGSLGSRTSSGLLVSIPTPALGPVSEGGLHAVLGSTSATAGGAALPTDLPAGADAIPGFGDVIDVPGPFAGGGVLPPVITPSNPRGPAGFPAERVAYAFDGLPLSLLCGLVLLALAGASRLRRYVERIVGLVA
jgi:hypothetical protein